MARADLPAATVIDGRSVRLTSLDKVMYPDSGTTKREVLSYYAAVAPYFVAHAAMRPATRKRFVDGVGSIEQPGKVFFEKNLGSAVPSWVERRGIRHSDRIVTYPLINGAATLVWCAQMGALELHVPQWRFDGEEPQHPDRLVLDLDPGPGVGLDACVEVALLCREILDGVGLPSVPVTSGSKGIHLYARLDGSQTSDQASQFAHTLALALEADHPDLIVSDMKKSLRGGKVLLDWSQNNGSKTTIAPYSLRGTPTPRVACPRDWAEIQPGLAHVDMYDVVERLESRGDPMSVLLDEDDALGRSKVVARVPRPAEGTAPARPAEEVRTPTSRDVSERLRRSSTNVKRGTASRSSTDVKRETATRSSTNVKRETATRSSTAAKRTETPRDDSVAEPNPGLLKPMQAGAGSSRSSRSSTDVKRETATRSSTAAKRTETSRDDSIAGRHPGVLRPMQATAGSIGQVRGPGWVYEVKWDGYRALATVGDGQVRLTSRNGIDLTKAYPELQEIARQVTSDCVLDGEIVAVGPSGRPSFELLQTRAKTPSLRVQMMLFDVLEVDGESQLQKDYLARRAVLEGLVAEGRLTHVPPPLPGTADEALATSASLRLEGIVAKRADSSYRPGIRTVAWIKLKNAQTQEVVVIGWSPGSGNRAGTIGSLLVAVPDETGELRYAGRVGSGFSDRSLAETLKKLGKIERRTPQANDIPREDAKEARWVSPVYVGEVSHAEWTTTHRLRQPVWKGWRPDKKPGQVRRES